MSAAHTPTPGLLERELRIALDRAEWRNANLPAGLQPENTSSIKSALLLAPRADRCVNAHAELVAAAENAIYWALKQHAMNAEAGACNIADKPGWIVSLRAALAKATGGA